MDARDTELKKELNATLQARRELGDDYESALVDSFMAKVDQRIAGAVERRLRRRLAEQQMVGERFGFGIVSLVLAIPLSAIGAGTAHLPGLLVSWVGIVGVNVVQAARTNPGLFRGWRHRAKDEDRWED